MVLIFGFFNFETKLFKLLDIEIADLTTLELQHCNVEKWDFRLPVPGSQQQNLLYRYWYSHLSSNVTVVPL